MITGVLEQSKVPKELCQLSPQVPQDNPDRQPKATQCNVMVLKVTFLPKLQVNLHSFF